MLCAIASNENIAFEYRDKAFDFGCDYNDIQNLTPHMLEDLYYFWVDCWKSDYEEIDKEAKQIAFEKIKKNIDKFSVPCLIDLIDKIRCEPYSDENTEILSLIAQNSKDCSETGRVHRNLSECTAGASR